MDRITVCWTARIPSRISRRVRAVAFVTTISSIACASGGKNSGGGSPIDTSKHDEVVAREAADRAELVLPAPSYWKPRFTGTQIALNLVLERSSIKAGERPKYRIEIQNVGSKDVQFYENPSFIKWAPDARRNGYKFLLTFPSGEEAELPPPMLRFTGPAHGGHEVPVDVELFVDLHPGETLVSRADPAGSGYRELATAFDFDPAGVYSLRVVYDRKVRSGLYAESNRASLIVNP